jgi:hypothetical protein
MELVNRYKINARHLRFGRGKEKLQELWDTVLAEIDLDALLHQPNEHLFVVDVEKNQVKEYAAKGMHIESSTFYPLTEYGEDMINIHTHPIGSFRLNDEEGVTLSRSDFPSLTDLNSLLDATLHYSLEYGTYTPSVDYILGWGDYDNRSIHLIRYRFTKELIDYLLSDESEREDRIEDFRENLQTALNIVGDDKYRRVNFSDEMYRELNENFPYDFKVLKRTTLKADPVA